MIGNFLFVMLSILFVIPNALIAVFLSNLHNIAAVRNPFRCERTFNDPNT